MEETSRQIPHPAGRLSGSRVRRGRPLPSLRQVLDSDVGVTIGQAYQVEKVIGAVKAVKVSSGLGNRKLLTAKEIRALVDGCDRPPADALPGIDGLQDLRGAGDIMDIDIIGKEQEGARRELPARARGGDPRALQRQGCLSTKASRSTGSTSRSG